MAYLWSVWARLKFPSSASSEGFPWSLAMPTGSPLPSLGSHFVDCEEWQSGRKILLFCRSLCQCLAWLLSTNHVLYAHWLRICYMQQCELVKNISVAKGWIYFLKMHWSIILLAKVNFWFPLGFDLLQSAGWHRFGSASTSVVGVCPLPLLVGCVLWLCGDFGVVGALFGTCTLCLAVVGFWVGSGSFQCVDAADSEGDGSRLAWSWPVVI